MTGSIVDEVCALERELLEPSTRADRERLSQTLHPDFVEIGASGTIWDRDRVIEELVSQPGERVEVSDLAAHRVGDGVVLVTYSAAASRRSSLWVRTAGGWQVRFHQGTPRAS